MKIAITRAVSPAIGRCELTHLAREPIDFELVVAQHSAYCAVLERLGCRLIRLEAEPGFPDSVFVEDVAVVLDEVAVMTRPGAESRRTEGERVEAALAEHRPIVRIESPGTIDGGDVVLLGRVAYVGMSSRSNEAGLTGLRACVEPFGYTVRAVPVRGCLHLKSACTAIGPATVLINSAWADAACFEGAELIDIDDDEPSAANALMIGDSLVYDRAYPRSREKLENRGFRVAAVDLSELAKAEGAVTCLSLLFDAEPHRSER